MKPILKKLNKIYRSGYIASRGNQSYDFLIKGYSAANFCNCFGHACFNLKNQHFVENNFTPTDTACIGGDINLEQASDKQTKEYEEFYLYIKNFYKDQPEDVKERLFNMVSSTGLSVEKCAPSEILKDNQWKIALYFDYLHGAMFDYHFFLQEKDGSWSSKMGQSKKVDIFYNLNNYMYATYKLHGFYSITNPFAAKENKINELLK